MAITLLANQDLTPMPMLQQPSLKIIHEQIHTAKYIETMSVSDFARSKQVFNRLFSTRKQSFTNSPILIK